MKTIVIRGQEYNFDIPENPTPEERRDVALTAIIFTLVTLDIPEVDDILEAFDLINVEPFDEEGEE